MTSDPGIEAEMPPSTDLDHLREMQTELRSEAQSLERYGAIGIASVYAWNLTNLNSASMFVPQIAVAILIHFMAARAFCVRRELVEVRAEMGQAVGRNPGNEERIRARRRIRNMRAFTAYGYWTVLSAASVIAPLVGVASG